MAVKFQYNKTALQGLNKQLKVRQRALPTLKNKESALRVEVKRAKDKAAELEANLEAKVRKLDAFMRLWAEFEPDLIKIDNVDIRIRKIAGVKIPVMGEITFQYREFSMFLKYEWFLDGLTIVRELSEISIEREFYIKKMKLLDMARKKTTQKVNLYEKVQIPAFEDAIRKIKRFLEDEENLSKSGQKILKSRADAAGEGAA